MLKGIVSSTYSWGDNVLFVVLFAFAYPFAVLAEAIKRAMAPVGVRLPTTSLFAEARENTSIAISYAVMAKSTLKRTSRQQR